MVARLGSSLDIIVKQSVLFVGLWLKNSNFKKNLVKSWFTNNRRYVKTVKPEQSTQSTGYRKYELNFETRFENLEIGRRKKWGSEVYLLTICSFAKKSEESTQQFIENLSIITRVACKAPVSPKNDVKMCFLAQTSVYCLAETKVTLNK